ncbi:MAG: hypothetical protein H6704_10510 [Myxococcales bacterium]|nr:hypothetical protein [Myxococcales bacterium]
MPPAVMAAAAALVIAPPLVAWALGRAWPGRGWWAVGLGALGAAAAAGLAFWWMGPVVEAALAAHREAFQQGDGHAYDWAALDQPGRRAVLDAIQARLAHGRLLAGARAGAAGLGAAFAGAVVLRYAYLQLLTGRAPWAREATQDPPDSTT